MNTAMKFSVTGQRIELTEPVMLVAGSMNIYTASFAFDSAWEGHTKTAVFRGGDVEREQMLTDDSCEVPWEVLLPGAYLKVGVYGTRDGIRLPTIWTERTQYINSGAGPTEEAAEPSPTLVEQLLTKVGDLAALKTEDKTSVVAAINEVWASGGGGSGASVTDAAINEDGHLIITLSTGKQIDAGYAVGPAGADGQDGANGKSAYQYAKDGGYTGTEAEFAAKMAAEIPSVDTTLTESGKAADAAAVGARLSSLSEEIGNKADKTEGGGTSETVTAEKIYAASVKSLKQVGTNNYIPQKDSVLFVANADGVVNVGSDNIIDYTINNFTPNQVITEPLHIVTAIDKGYHFELNPNYTASTHFSNSRFFLKANIVSGKTYTLSFQQSVKIYVYLSPDAEDPSSNALLITTGATTDLQSVTFTAEKDYQAVRFAPSSLPADLTNVTLCEGETPLPYGGETETYTVTAGKMLYLTNVLKQNIVGNGAFYESPIAITSLNGQETADGNMNTCTTNKVWVNMGDSIWTFGASTGGIGTITDYMLALCGGTWHNIATGGTTMASRPGDYAGNYDALDFWKLADAIVAGDYTDAKAAAAELTSNFANVDSIDWSEVNYITIAYGTNDLAFGAEIDNASNMFDTATICGALRYGIKSINSAYPNIRFKVLGVLYRNADSVSMPKIVECNNALKNAAAYVGAEFIDGYGINEGNRSTYLYDGTHPNGEGKQRIAETLARNIHDIWYAQ